MTADGITIVESSAIATYLLRTYDTSQRFSSTNWILDETLTSFAGSSLGLTIVVELLFDMVSNRTPWPLSYLANGIRSGMQKNYTGPEFKNAMGYLQEELGDKVWFNGNELGRADFMLSFPLDLMAQRGWMDLGREYPKIEAWRQRIQARDAWKRALEKGNGYDLSTVS